MAEVSFEKLVTHIGHKVVIAGYGDERGIWNVAIECETCDEVILSVDYNDENDDDIPF